MKTKTYKVYKMTNLINGKIYFGYTSYSLSFRLGGHGTEKRNTIISNSIRKYGKQNFTIELMEEHTTSEVALRRETFYITELKTNVLKYPEGNGMNMTDGGEGASGYKHSKELREYWSKVRKGTNTGKRNYNRQGRLVYIFTIEGKLEAKFDSCREAAKYLKVDGSNISTCCSGKHNTVKGKICQYTPDFIFRDLTPKPCRMFGSKNPRGRTCYLYDVNKKLVKTFGSFGEATKYLKLPLWKVRSIINSESHKINQFFLTTLTF